jgi:hypothetical protein
MIDTPAARTVAEGNDRSGHVQHRLNGSAARAPDRDHGIDDGAQFVA